MSRHTIGPSEIAWAAEVVRDADDQPCALALDVLSKQGQGHLLFAGKEFVASRAEEHDIDLDVEMGGERLIPLLQEGPTSPRQHALVAALALRGLRAHREDAERLMRFVRHADWLVLSTPYALHELIDPVLGDDAGPVWDAIADSLRHEKDASPASLARRALRLGALAQSSHERARDGLHHLAQEGDESTQALAQALGGAPRESGSGDELRGEMGSAPRSGARGALRLVSGWAALQWLGRGLGYAVGLRRRAALVLVPGGLELRRSDVILGKTVRESKQTFTLQAVAGGGRTTRFPALPLLAGALCFALGIIIGGVWLFEGLRSGETVLLGAGAGVILLGGGLDLALSVLLPARQGQVAVELRVLPRATLCLRRVPEGDAERFLDALRERLVR